MILQVPVTARRVSVGIVNHNGESYLLQTLRGGALRAGPRHGPVWRRHAALPGDAGAAPGEYARGAAGGRRPRGGDGHHLLRDGGPGALRRPAVVRRAPLLLSGGP